MAVDIEAAKRKLKELKEREKNSNFPWTQLEEGENLLRVLSDEDGNWYVETAYHYVPRGKEESLAVTCNKATDGSECWFCKKRIELFKTKNADDKKEATALYASPKIYMNVVNRKKENKHEVLGCGNQIFKGILKYFGDDEWGDITDPVKGYDIVVDKTKTGTGKKDVEYDAHAKKNPSPVGIDLSKIDLFDLTTIPVLYNEMEQEMLYEGATIEDIQKLRKEMEGEPDKGRMKVKKEEKTVEKVKEKEEVQKEEKEEVNPKLIKYANLIKKLPLDVPKVEKKFNAWLTDESKGKAELMDLIEMYCDDEEPVKEEVKEEIQKEEKEEVKDKDNDDELQAEIDEAMAKFEKTKSNKK